MNESVMQRIRAGDTRAEVEYTRGLYDAAAAMGRGGQVAVERAAYMRDILRRCE